MTIKKYLLTALYAVSASASLVASYEYDLSNFLADPIVIRINQRRVDNKDYYQIVNSFETVKQVFNNAYCLERLSWAPWDASKPLRGGLDLVDRKSGRIPEEKQRQFGDVVAPRYAFSPIEIKMQPNAVFQKTAQAATKLLRGIDTMGCQMLNEVKSFTGVTTNENFGKGISNSFSGRGETTPTSPASMSNHQLLMALQAEVNLKDRAKIEGFVAEHTTELKSIFNPSELADIKNAWLNDNVFSKANAHINAKLQIHTSVDTDNVINTSIGGQDSDISKDLEGMFSSSMGSSPNKAPLKDPNKCSFGLGLIGDASGKLAGYTLCKSRQFLIAPKVDKDGLPVVDYRLGGRMKVIAITVEGE